MFKIPDFTIPKALSRVAEKLPQQPPALLLVATMFFTSLYFTFRDTFEPPPAIAP